MIHQTIKTQIIEAMRAKDAILLETLRGLNALILNEMISSGTKTEFLQDDKVLALVKKSAKQRKDSIAQFDKGGRKDLADKERAELKILESFLPALMSREEIKTAASARINAFKAQGMLDPKAAASARGKIIGMIIKELAGKADGNDVKAVVEELLKA